MMPVGASRYSNCMHEVAQRQNDDLSNHHDLKFMNIPALQSLLA